MNQPKIRLHGQIFAPCKICIPHIPVGYAGGRATQEQLPRTQMTLIVMNNADFLWLILEKSFDPRKTQKARKYSKRYQVVDRHPKGE
ncbi:hypothetical protein [Methylobacter svalbardensis]|uniref:hypothetical protein n=1 Tax=Methylobacter svalbardensis TaxID=3080016 RepID=UPI0030EB33B3